ncbi:MAG: hypothetical protein H6Q18_133 [Bacteroidetes bacterium]|nr:hypothetical protein [Bacteroidota bacterium]
MIIKKTLTILACIILLISCTEIYSPQIDSKAEALVVEGLVTNEDGPFVIKLSKANLYNSTGTASYVEGAKLTIIDNHNQSFMLTDNKNGNYYIPYDFKAKTGDSYILHIETADGDIYESHPQTMLPAQSFDSIYGVHTTNSYIDRNKQLVNVIGSNINVDLFKNTENTDSAPVCRFKSTMTVQYEYWEDIDPIYYWVHKCWKNVSLNENTNITEDNSKKSNRNIKEHTVCFTPIGMEKYGLNQPLGYKSTLYYLRIDQYTINQNTYNFYKEANKQLSTSGKVFDPIASQLVGNISCINNTSKIALGFFEISSVTHSAIIIYQTINESRVNIYKVSYLMITDGEVKYMQKKTRMTPEEMNDPVFQDNTPSWFYHF